MLTCKKCDASHTKLSFIEKPTGGIYYDIKSNGEVDYSSQDYEHLEEHIYCTECETTFEAVYNSETNTYSIGKEIEDE